jgi:hypothetical protein
VECPSTAITHTSAMHSVPVTEINKPKGDRVAELNRPTKTSQKNPTHPKIDLLKAASD